MKKSFIFMSMVLFSLIYSLPSHAGRHREEQKETEQENTFEPSKRQKTSHEVSLELGIFDSDEDPSLKLARLNAIHTVEHTQNIIQQLQSPHTCATSYSLPLTHKQFLREDNNTLLQTSAAYLPIAQTGTAPTVDQFDSPLYGILIAPEKLVEDSYSTLMEDSKIPLHHPVPHRLSLSSNTLRSITPPPSPPSFPQSPRNFEVRPRSPTPPPIPLASDLAYVTPISAYFKSESSLEVSEENKNQNANATSQTIERYQQLISKLSQEITIIGRWAKSQKSRNLFKNFSQHPSDWIKHVFELNTFLAHYLQSSAEQQRVYNINIEKFNEHLSYLLIVEKILHMIKPIQLKTLLDHTFDPRPKAYPPFSQPIAFYAPTVLNDKNLNLFGDYLIQFKNHMTQLNKIASH